MPEGLRHLLRTATTFRADGEVDEDALAEYLQRFVEAGSTVIVASTGSGEGATLSWEDLGKVYRTAVAACGGKIPVYSNQPEQFTAKDSVEHAQLAIGAGIDAVNIYGPDGKHGFRATDAEYTAYFDYILGELHHPVTLCPNPVIGYSPKPPVIADLCNRHPQVAGVLLSGISGGDGYFLELRERLERDIAVYVNGVASMGSLHLGAAGIVDGAGNFIPRTYRRYLDLVEAGSLDEAARVYEDARKVEQLTARWLPNPPRWIKAMMQVFKLPGWTGGVRPPYLMLSDAEIEELGRVALELDVPEINEMAKAAGLR